MRVFALRREEADLKGYKNATLGYRRANGVPNL